ncbi:MFS transporter [Streptomyces roseirectus]|uniref:MFS transporter n=1 Tax=Streptomyces roseirectus TaxID=2768066 RepID=A0A7H0I895_9ACTN|nr:MFS transporter [Streptomyces roseirectus]QNP69011.1 MFS transporter [Streptomyces roseirectus]
MNSVDVAARSRAWWGLAVMLGPVLLVAMDGSVLFLAMPRIAEALEPTDGQALWILDAYGFAVGALLVAFGGLGDRYGRLRLLMAGTGAFGLASVGAAFAPGPELLIVCRALMGVAGATLLPSALAVVSGLFADPRERSRAIGIFAATFAAGFGIGPVVGGWLLSGLWWGSVFLVNLPVVVGFLGLAPVLLREVRGGRGDWGDRVDLPSVVSSAVGILAVVHAVKQSAAEGADAGAVVTGVGGAVVLGWFVRRQLRLEEPLLDVRLFRDRVFAVAVATGFLPLAAWSASAYLGGVYLQSVLGLTVLQAASAALPGAVVLTVTCVVTPALVIRTGTRAALVACHLLVAAGMLVLAGIGTGGGLGWYLASTVVAGVGYGISFSVVADTAVGAVPLSRAGSAAAIAETANELGNALGIALLGSLAAWVQRLHGTGELTGVGGESGYAATSAFVVGYQVAVVVAGLLHIALGAIALRQLPRVKRGFG